MLKVYYGVFDKDGELVFNRTGGARVYEDRKKAERWAVWEGDAVVELVFNTDTQPLFIRAKTVRPG
jgi:hypothetical protein